MQLGVQVIGSNIGLRATLEQSVAAANAWADATEAAGVRAGQGIAAGLAMADESQAALRGSFVASTEAASVFSSETMAASVRAARSLELVGVAAAQGEIAFSRLGMAVSRYGAGTVGEAAAVARYTATIQGLYDKQIAAADAAAAAQDRAALRFTNSARTVGRTMTTYVSLPLLAIGYEAIKLSTSFQASMTRIQTYAGASAKEVKFLNSSLLDMAGTIPQGPIKAADALYHLESIGIRGVAALHALQAASFAAGAGMANLTDATTAVGGALVADIKGAQTAKQAMAGLVAITGEGNMTMQEMTGAMSTGLIVKAHNVGLSLREVGAALAVLVDRGIPARRAGTYLGATFALMLAPSAAASNALKDMGINADQLGTMLRQPDGLLKVLEMLHAAVQRVGPVRGIRDLVEAFGRSRQSTGIQTLVESMDSKISNYSGKLAQYDKGVQQATERMAAYQQTSQYKLHTALSLIEADFIRLGQGVAPQVAGDLKGLATVITDIAKAFESLPAPMKRGLGVLAGAAAIIGPSLLVLAALRKSLLAVRTMMSGGSASAGLDEIGVASAAAQTRVVALEEAIATLQTQIEGLAPADAAAAEGLGAIDAASVEATTGIAALNEQLALLKTQLAMATVEADAFAASEVPAGSRGLLGSMGMIGRVGMYGVGGLVAGQMAQSMIPGEAGQGIGGALEGAGVGAAIGTMTPFGPLGTAVGAGLGAITGGLLSVVHEAPSFAQQMQNMSSSVEGFGTAARDASGNIIQLHARIADLRVSRDRLQQQIKADRATYGANPTKLNQDQLISDLAQIQAYDQQIAASNRGIAAQDKARTNDLRQQKDQLQGIVEKAQNLSDIGVRVVGGTKGGAGISWFAIGDQLVKIGDQTNEAKTKIQAYEKATLDMAQQSTGKLQQVYYKLHDIAVQTNNIPTHHQVKIVVDAVYTKAAKDLPGFFFGLDKLARGLSNDIQGMFKGLSKPGTTSKGHPTPYKNQGPLTGQQQMQLGLAADPKNKKLLEEEIRKDNEGLRWLTKARQEGRISNKQYVTLSTNLYQDRASAESALASGAKKATSNQNKAAAAFKRAVEQDQLYAKARLDLANGELTAARQLLLRDRARLEAMLKEAKTSQERLVIENQLTKVDRLLHSKSNQFQLDPKLQEATARADALAALDPNLQGPTALQIKLAKKAKAEAMKAINSHMLTLQGLTAAWQIVGQENSILAQKQKGFIDTYHAVSTDAVTKGLGLTHAQDMALRERLAQSEAHRGYAPNDQGAPASSPQGKQAMVDRVNRVGHSDRASVQQARMEYLYDFRDSHFHGITDVKKLWTELERIRRSSHGRAGARR